MLQMPVFVTVGRHVFHDAAAWFVFVGGAFFGRWRAFGRGIFVDPLEYPHQWQGRFARIGWRFPHASEVQRAGTLVVHVTVEPQQQLGFHVSARRRFFALVDADVVRRIGHQVGQLRRLAGCMRRVQGDGEAEAGAERERQARRLGGEHV